MDYSNYIAEIINDMDHLLLSDLDKIVSNDLYSVEYDSSDNSITIIFEQEIDNQNDTIELLSEEILQGINHDLVKGELTVIMLKRTGIEDVYAELVGFELEGDEDE